MQSTRRSPYVSFCTAGLLLRAHHDIFVNYFKRGAGLFFISIQKCKTDWIRSAVFLQAMQYGPRKSAILFLNQVRKFQHFFWLSNYVEESTVADNRSQTFEMDKDNKRCMYQHTRNGIKQCMKVIFASICTRPATWFCNYKSHYKMYLRLFVVSLLFHNFCCTKRSTVHSVCQCYVHTFLLFGKLLSHHPSETVFVSQININEEC